MSSSHNGWGYMPYVPPVPQPGVVPLRPLNLGDIVAGVFGTLRRYFRALYLPLLAVAGGALVLVAGYTAVAYSVLGDLYEKLRDADDHGMTPGEVTTLVSVLVGGVLLLAVLSAALYVVAAATGTVVLRHAVIGRPVTAARAWAEARPWLGRVLASYLLPVGAMMALLVAAEALVLAVAGLSGSVGTVLLGFLVLPFLCVAAVYVKVRLVLQVPVLVLEETGVVPAIRRAWRLNEGNWWRSLGIPLLLGMLGSAVVQLVLGPVSAVGMSMVFPTGEIGPDTMPDFGGLIGFLMLLLLVGFLGTVATLPLMPLTNGLLYIDRRIRNERLDIALGEAAGIWTTQPAPQPAPQAETPQDDTGRESED